MEDRKDNPSGVRKAGVMTQQIGFGLSLSGWIAFPVIFGFFLGRYIVQKFDLPEYTLYIFLGLSVIWSFYGLTKECIRYAKKMQAEDSKSKESKVQNSTSIQELSYNELEK